MINEIKEKQKQYLTPYEQETIINFNKEETLASIFTYEKTWQRHLEQKLGLKPTIDNGYGGKEYEIPKNLILMPRPKKQYSEQTKTKMAARLAQIRKKPRFNRPSKSDKLLQTGLLS